MAVTPMPTTSDLAAKLWAKKTIVDAIKSTAFGHMLRRGSIELAPELHGGTNYGDEVTVGYVPILTGQGVTENESLQNNEEAFDLQAFKMKINETWHAVVSPSRMNIQQQRTNVDFVNLHGETLKNWQLSRLDASLFNQLAGVTATSIEVDGTTYTGDKRNIVLGHNTAVAPTTDRIVWAGSATNDQGLTSSDTFTLSLIDEAIERMATTQDIGGALANETYDLFLHPKQVTDMRGDTTGKVQWLDNARALANGGKFDDLLNTNSNMVTPVATYGNVMIYSRNRVAQGVNSSTSAAISTVRRAVLVGRKAAMFASTKTGAFRDAEGMKRGDVPLYMVDNNFEQNYGRQKGLGAGMIYGLKKTNFNNEDYGVVVISTYA